MTDAAGTGPSCQVHGGTGVPCTRRATEEIFGVPFCGPHAREQETRFAIGELAQAYGVVADWEKHARHLGNGPLVEALGRTQRDLDGRVDEERKRLEARRVRS